MTPRPSLANLHYFAAKTVPAVQWGTVNEVLRRGITNDVFRHDQAIPILWERCGKNTKMVVLSREFAIICKTLDGYSMLALMRPKIDLNAFAVAFNTK